MTDLSSSPVLPLFSAEQIAQRIDLLAQLIAAKKMHNPLVISVLKGSFMFAADLLRALHNHGMSPQAEFIHLSSYRSGTASSGSVDILRDLDSTVKDRDVLLVDDILESGRTLAFAHDLILARGARSADVCVLLEKAGKRQVQIDATYVGFACPDQFVIGYGMDVGHHWRQLPFIGVLKKRDDDAQLNML